MTSLCVVFAGHLAHFQSAKVWEIMVVGGEKETSIVKSCYVQLTCPDGWSARNLEALFFKLEA
jgi:hypothetical protein